PRQPKARTDGELLDGRTFVAGRASYSRWCLEFTGGGYIDIVCRDDEVGWSVTQEAPVFDDSSEADALRWPSGAERTIDPAELFASRVRAEFRQLWVNEAGFCVYLDRKPILCFHVVRSVEDRACILAVCEDD